jgi:hypothetical protein
MLIHLLKYYRGLNLLNAPNIGDHLFIGRDNKLKQMKTILLSDPNSSDRKVLMLDDISGIGKTQMVIRYTKRHYTFYLSVF